MPITLNDMMPVGLCLATQELFDAKRFQSNFCDTLLLRLKDKKLEPKLTNIRRELNSLLTQKKFLEGHKTVIINNIDRIIGMVSSRYAKMDLRLVEDVVSTCKELIEKVMLADSFDEIAELEPTFRSKVTLPVYSLFNKSMKRTKVI